MDTAGPGDAVTGGHFKLIQFRARYNRSLLTRLHLRKRLPMPSSDDSPVARYHRDLRCPVSHILSIEGHGSFVLRCELDDGHPGPHQAGECTVGDRLTIHESHWL